MTSEFVHQRGLSLWQWAKQMGLSPWRVGGFGVNVPDCRGPENCCAGTWHEYTYQTGSLSRRDVIAAIEQAEAEFALKIGYWPSPHYVEGERMDYPNLGAYGMLNMEGQPKSVLPNWGRILIIGQQVWTLINPSVAVTYDNPLALTVQVGSEVSSTTVSVNDIWEATLTVPAGTLASELRIFHSEDERLDEDRDEWPIAPVEIEISGTTANLRGKAWQMGKPSLLMRTDCEELDAADSDSYVEEIEVWRVTYDVCEQGNFIYRVSNCATPPCGETTYGSCYSTIDAVVGYVAPVPAACDEDDTFQRVRISECYAPDFVSINYVSGIALLPNGNMDKLHAKIISYLAASYLDCSICACGCTGDRLKKYADYPKVTITESVGGDTDKRYRAMIPNIGPSATPDPEFGLKYGQTEAWRMARNLRIRMGGTAHPINETH